MHATCVRGNPIFAGGTAVRLRRVFRVNCGNCASLSVVVLLCVSAAEGQGAAPETAPPLFPGGGLISYNSIFTTRGLTESSANIPATARPTFGHEGDFNFTWGFRRNFDLTILVPIVTNHFQMAGHVDSRRNGAWRCHGAREVPLLSTRFSREGPHRHRSRLGPKIPTGRTDLIDKQMEAGSLPVCSPAQVPLICLRPPIGLTPGFSICGVWWRMKIFIPCSAHKVPSRRGSAATSNRVSGFRIVHMSRRTWRGSGSSVPR